MAVKRPVCVAVIDDGINEKLYGFGCLDVNITINSELAIENRKHYDALLPSHGTTCAAIIKKYAPDAKLASIKILNDLSGTSRKNQLIAAIKWCADNGLKLVNLSLGTIDFRDFDEIRNCVNRAYEKGLIIVAACNNKNVYTVPSCLTNVIGVRCRKIYTDAQYRFIRYPFDGIDVEASGRHMLTDIFGNSRYTSPANSYAAPLVTALVCKMLMKNPGIALEEIREELYKNALNFDNNCYDPYRCINSDWLEEGAEPDKYTGCYYKSVRSNGLKKQKVWDPGFYKAQLDKHVNKTGKDLNIPVIAIFNEGTSDILNNLNMLFRNDGYYSVMISEDYSDIPKGCEYLPEGVSANDFISMICNKYLCDAVLLKINNRKSMDDNDIYTLFDMILHVYADKIIYSFTDGNEVKSDNIAVVRGREDEQLKDVYERIVNILQGT